MKLWRSSPSANAEGAKPKTVNLSGKRTDADNTKAISLCFLLCCGEISGKEISPFLFMVRRNINVRFFAESSGNQQRCQ